MVVSVWLQVGSLVLAVLSYILSSGPGGATNGLTGAAGVGWTVFVVLVIAFWLFVARETWLGKPWARMVQTVLLPFQIASAVIDLVAGSPTYDALDYIGYLMSIAAVILLWTPSSRRYFAEVSAARRRSKPIKPIKPYLGPRLR